MMLNRRHIRVKVMQTMYAFKGSESDDFSKEAQKIKNQKIWIRLGGPLLAAGLLIGLGKFLSAVASAGSW